MDQRKIFDCISEYWTLNTVSDTLRLLGAAPGQGSILDDDDLRREVLLPDGVLSDELASHPQPAAQRLNTAGRSRGASTVIRLKDKRQSDTQTF